jgi:hypothetical protein
MRLFLFLVSLTCLAAPAGSWSGFLVDAECLASHNGNTRPGTHPGTVDNNRLVRVCAPTSETKTFAVMEVGGSSFMLDSEGNQKAHGLVQKAGAASSYKVNVTGDMTENTVKVAKISLAK